MLPAISRPLLVRQFDQNVGAAADVNQLGLDEVSHYITWNDQTTGGEVTIESADDANYAGAWAAMTKTDGTPAVIPWSGANRQDRIVTAGGASAVIRHRVSQAIQGGPGANVSTRLVGSV